VGARLQLEPGKCEDPHVERLLEGFAFLAARVHRKLDEDFPEITEALLGVVYPHHVRPVPAMSVVQFRLDPEQGKLTSGHALPRGTTLLSREVHGAPCRFRTCYDTTLWPVEVAAAEWLTADRLGAIGRDAVAALRVELQCQGGLTFDALSLDTLRLYIDGDAPVAYALYELLCNNLARIELRDRIGAGASPAVVRLPATALAPVGFGEHEGMLPLPGHSFAAYQYLQEYFTFPYKFRFVDVSGLGALRAAGFKQRAELLLLFSPFERAERRQLLEAGVTARTLRPGCAPVVNLFPRASEPIALSQRRPEYRVVSDTYQSHAVQVYSVDEVRGAAPLGATPPVFSPLYAFRHAPSGGAAGGDKRVFWLATRRASGWSDDGASDVYLTFADRSGQPVHPDVDAATAHVTCFNGDLPSRLPFGDERGDFDLTDSGPVQSVVALVKPTVPIYPPLGRPQLWHVLSQLSLNYLSIVDDGADALRAVLRLHNPGDVHYGDRQIEGLLSVRSAPSFARVVSDHGLAFVRGRRVEVSLDEEQFVGGGVFLFATVLERFLALYASMNSFTVLSARTRQRKEILREWLPRTGRTVLL
jgi:type VI secretion system protein ImpG